VAKLSGRTQIEPQDVGEMNALFLDAKRSAIILKDSKEMGNGGQLPTFA
jgi:DNA helicase TIP49 (TBP-interacting protein)